MKGLWNLFKITIIIIAITCNLRIKKKIPTCLQSSLVGAKTNTYNIQQVVWMIS